MRLFVAVEIDDALVRAATALIAELRAQAAQVAPHARITWLAADRLHLTLAFLGNIDDSWLPGIRQALWSPHVAPRFSIRFRGVGVFPARGRPRVVWMGIDAGREALVTLAAEVATRLTRVGVMLEDRAYSPHLTLGRVREAGELRASTLTAGREDAVLGMMVVGPITLFESRLSPSGPAYRPIERIECGPA